VGVVQTHQLIEFIDKAEFNKIDSNQDGFLNYAEAEDINIFIRSV
jgi:hypothetical protein